MKSILNNVRADSVVERVRTDSILNPLLWICGITEIVAVPAALLSNGGVQVFFCALAATPVIAALVAYFIWMFRDPNRLQSEDYQIKQQIIQQGSKEHDFIANLPHVSDHPTRQIEDIDLLTPDAPSELIGSSASKNGA